LKVLENSLNLEKFEKEFKFKSLKKFEKKERKLSKPLSLPFPFFSSPRSN
jgi:hypothetical protein